MKILYIIRGLPGSGKSTLARDLADLNHTFDWYEADDYFADALGHYYFQPKLLGQAHDWCHTMVSRALARNSPCVIVSNTFSRLWEMQEYINEAKALGYAIQVIHCEGQFGNIHNCPQETIDKMRKRWEPYVPLPSVMSTQPMPELGSYGGTTVD